MDRLTMVVAATGFFCGFRLPYFLGFLIAALPLIYQSSIVTPYDFNRLTQAYFMRNGIVSEAMFLCAWWGLA